MTIANEINEMSKVCGLKEAKDGFFSGKDANMIGGYIGVGIAVALELVSPTGSKTSAICAAIAGGAALYYGKEIIEAAPQGPAAAAAVGATSCYLGMCAGRIAACYFPGDLED